MAVLALAIFWTLLALPARAQVCDYTGFEKPCEVHGGDYRVLVPEGEGPFPVMLYLYGSGGQSTMITDHPVFQESVVGRGYVLVVPGARDIVYYGFLEDTGWGLLSDDKPVRNEFAFLQRVIDNVARRFPIDRNRILITGQSRGGFLTWEIACHKPDLGAAFAVHAAGYLGPLPQRCTRPVRLMHTHGLADPVVPMASVEVFSGGNPLPALADTMTMMARSNGCRDYSPADDRPFYALTRKTWSGCRSGGSLDLMLHPGGHTMPWVWFRAVLDWFEEEPEARVESKPVTRTIGADRPEGLFKAKPLPGSKRLPAPSE
jgi:polyhydroxybutyrate depolymerase